MFDTVLIAGLGLMGGSMAENHQGAHAQPRFGLEPHACNCRAGTG